MDRIIGGEQVSKYGWHKFVTSPSSHWCQQGEEHGEKSKGIHQKEPVNKHNVEYQHYHETCRLYYNQVTFTGNFYGSHVSCCLLCTRLLLTNLESNCAACSKNSVSTFCQFYDSCRVQYSQSVCSADGLLKCLPPKHNQTTDKAYSAQVINIKNSLLLANTELNYTMMTYSHVELKCYVVLNQFSCSLLQKVVYLQSNNNTHRAQIGNTQNILQDEYTGDMARTPLSSLNHSTYG